MTATFVQRSRTVVAAQYVPGKNHQLSSTVRRFQGEVDITGFCRDCHRRTSVHGEVATPFLGQTGSFWQKICPRNWIVEEELPNGSVAVSVISDEDFHYWFTPGGNHHGNTDARAEGED